VKPERFAITIAADHESSTDPRIRNAFFIVTPNCRQLMEIAGMIDMAKLRTFVDAVVPLAEANEAYTGSPAGRRNHGKLVVAVDPNVRYTLLPCSSGVNSSDRPFHAIWTPIQRRMKAMTRKMPCAVDGDTFCATFGA
jgi:hypothetical protein